MQRASRVLFGFQWIRGNIPRIHVGMVNKFRFHHIRPINMGVSVKPAAKILDGVADFIFESHVILLYVKRVSGKKNPLARFNEQGDQS